MNNCTRIADAVLAGPGEREVSFVVEGIPCGKAKKLGIVRGHAHGYNDAKTTNYQNLVTNAATLARRSKPFDGPVILRVVAVFPRTSAQCKRSKRTGALLAGMSEGRIPKDTKPDHDNLLKSICDGINASGLWKDDAKVFDSRLVKWHAATDEYPHIQVTVREWEGEV